MTVDWALTPDGDLTVPSRLVRGHDLVLQRVRVRLHTHLGEWILDQGVGLPYADWRARKPIPLQEIVAAVRREIVDTPGVLQDLGVSGEVAGRTVRVRGTFLLEPLDSLAPQELVEFEADVGGNSHPFIISFTRVGPCL